MSKLLVDAFTLKPVNSEQAEAADYCVCLRKEDATPFSDNEFGVCCACGAEVQFRPYMPKRPPKICLPCAVEMQKVRH